LERLLERLKRWGVRLSCTDGLEAHAVLIPQGSLYVGKDETHGIERDHARQRHWLVRIRRCSIVVPETRGRGDASMARFARFARNTSIRDLVSMLA
jgi:insertion element IS1 protein InsB